MQAVPTKPTVRKYTIEEFLAVHVTYVPRSNSDVYIKGAISERDMSRRERFVLDFLRSMHGKESALSNFRVVYEVSRGCCAFWKPSEVRLFQKSSSSSDKLGPLMFEGSNMSIAAYSESVVLDQAQALASVRDYGTSRR